LIQKNKGAIQMAENKEKKVSEENKAPNPNELVSYTLFYDGKEYKDDVVVIINGKNFTYKRGTTYMIPRYVHDVIVGKERHRAKTNDFNRAQQEAFAASSKNI
jgi:hypothetical protein